MKNLKNLKGVQNLNRKDKKLLEVTIMVSFVKGLFGCSCYRL